MTVALMDEHLRFKDVKLQWLELLTCDALLSDCAICIGAHIALRYVNSESEVAWPSQEVLANGTGKSIKTIQRAIRELVAFKWFEVRRGNGRGLNTRYRPTEDSIERARALRIKKDKVVTLYPEKGGHSRPERQSELARKEGQKCPPNLKNQTNIKPNASTATELSPDARRAIPQIFVAECEVHKLDHWRAWMSDHDLPSLSELGLRETRRGIVGFLLPSNYPPGSHDDKGMVDRLDYFRKRQAMGKSEFRDNQKSAR